ncbi:hypothetical protein J7J95_01140 [bacterium]|nr:hypothetical protein [bacterium]
MASQLTHVAYVTRKAIKFSFIAILAFFLLKTAFGIFRRYWLARHPPPKPPPDVAFGKLPPVLTLKEKTEWQFSLQTVSGDLPQFPDREKVFFVVPQDSQLLALEKTNQLAKNLGFVSPPQKIKENLYRYQNKPLKLTLTINPLTKSFVYQYPYLEDQTLMALPLPLSEEKIITTAERFLDRIGRSHPDIDKTKTKVTFWQITPQGRKPAPSLAEANLAHVNFYREDIEGKPVLPPDLDNANISIWVSGDINGNRAVVEAKYTYFYIDKEKSATYPLKPISQAWEELKEGKYHLARTPLSSLHQPIPIRNIYLAFLDPAVPTNFLQPIFVFEGDYNFVAFVPAISSEWFSE